MTWIGDGFRLAETGTRRAVAAANRWVFRTVAVMGPLLLGSPEPGSAQQGPGAAPSRGPGWLPRLSYLDAQQVRLTATERTTVLARLAEIERILAGVDVLARPAGFEIQPILYGGNDPGTTGDVIGSRYQLRFYLPSRKIAAEGGRCIDVAINFEAGASKTPYRDDSGDLYFELDPGDPVPGATHAWERLSPTQRSWTTVAFSADGRSPWRSVTREGFLEAVIYGTEGKDSKNATTYRDQLLQTPYQKWLAEAEERRKHRESLIGEVRKVDAERGAELRRTLETAEREATEQFKASEVADRVENAKVLATPTLGTRLRARIAAMPPADRAAPAWLDRMDATGDFVFVPPAAPLSIHVVRPDPTFFKARRSRVETRLITVKISASLACQAPLLHRALYQVYRRLDWSALATLAKLTS